MHNYVSACGRFRGMSSNVPYDEDKTHKEPRQTIGIDVTGVCSVDDPHGQQRRREF